MNHTRPLIVGLGEILWDVLPDGAKFGGAPANFACSAAGLTNDSSCVFVASAVGKDEFGDRAIESLRIHGVETKAIMRLPQSTGCVLINLDAQGKATYEFADDTAWDNLTWSGTLEDLAENCDALCFGTLGQRSQPSRETIQRFVRQSRPNCLRIFDINLRPPFYNEQVIDDSLQIANVLKLNDEELPLLVDLYHLRGDIIDQLHQLAQRFSLGCIALTRGEQGAILVRGNEIEEQAGTHVAVVDTVGAGDAFTAALAHGLLANKSLPTIIHEASKIAAFVCTQAGATPTIPPALRLQSI